MRASRLVAIADLLQARGRMTAGQLADALEVSPRTILRDLSELSGAGIPVFAVRGSAGGFELISGYAAGRPPFRRSAGRARRSHRGRRAAGPARRSVRMSCSPRAAGNSSRYPAGRPISGCGAAPVRCLRHPAGLRAGCGPDLWSMLSLMCWDSAPRSRSSHRQNCGAPCRCTRCASRGGMRTRGAFDADWCCSWTLAPPPA